MAITYQQSALQLKEKYKKSKQQQKLASSIVQSKSRTYIPSVKAHASQNIHASILSPHQQISNITQNLHVRTLSSLNCYPTNQSLDACYQIYQDIIKDKENIAYQPQSKLYHQQQESQIKAKIPLESQSHYFNQQQYQKIQLKENNINCFRRYEAQKYCVRSKSQVLQHFSSTILINGEEEDEEPSQFTEPISTIAEQSDMQILESRVETDQTIDGQIELLQQQRIMLQLQNDSNYNSRCQGDQSSVSTLFNYIDEVQKCRQPPAYQVRQQQQRKKQISNQVHSHKIYQTKAKKNLTELFLVTDKVGDFESQCIKQQLALKFQHSKVKRRNNEASCSNIQTTAATQSNIDGLFQTFLKSSFSSQSNLPLRTSNTMKASSSTSGIQMVAKKKPQMNQITKTIGDQSISIIDYDSQTL